MVHDTRDSAPNDSTQRNDPGIDAHRRRVLLGLIGAAGAVAIPSAVWRTAAADAAQVDATVATNFLALSQSLTQRNTLDPTIARRLYAALAAQDGGFADAAAALTSFVQQHPGTPEAIVAAVSATQPTLVPALHKVISGWYLGVVSDAPDAEVIAYDKALMFVVTGDVTPPPSYCQRAPNYWTSKPVDA